MNTMPCIFGAICALTIAAPRAQERPTEPAPPASVSQGRNGFAIALESHLDAHGPLQVALRPIIRDVGEPFVLEAGEHALPELIDRTATWLGRNYLTSPADFQGPNLTVRLQTELHLDEDGLERTLGHLLYSRGFAVVTLSEPLGLYEVVSLVGPRRAELYGRATERSPEEILERADRMEVVATTVVLHHTNAQIASNALRPFFAQATPMPSLVIGSTGDSQSLLLQGFAPQVASAIRMLHRADEAAAEAARRDAMERIEQRIEQLEQRGR